MHRSSNASIDGESPAGASLRFEIPAVAAPSPLRWKAFFETAGVIMLATAFQLPFHLVLAGPVLLLAWFLSTIFRPSENGLPRRALLTGVVAFGIAPLYGFHFSMVPVYWGFFS